MTEPKEEAKGPEAEGRGLIVACIPAYKEERTIARVVLQTAKLVDKVIVCDDGSSDMTAEIAERLGAEVVQGAQRTDLNSGESWVARATSLMLDGFNFVELWAKGKLGLVIPITGSNFMAKTDVLRRYGFDEDIAEDWSMTARLWGDGVGVVYDPTIVVRSESPPSLVAAIRQFSRWAEGTIRVTVRRAALVASSKAMTLRQKLDFFMSGFSYFTSVLFILIIAGGILMPVPAFSTPPTPFLFWGTVVGLMGLPALPISLIAARRASGTRVKASTVLLALLEGYLIFPFTAYAALRGLFRGRGSFQRTAKTGWMDGGERLIRHGRPLKGFLLGHAAVFAFLSGVAVRAYPEALAGPCPLGFDALTTYLSRSAPTPVAPLCQHLLPTIW